VRGGKYIESSTKTWRTSTLDGYPTGDGGIRLDWKAGLVTFAVIFLAELGDKTQLMVMSLSARSKAPYTIFLGAAAALIASSLLAVWAGDTLLRTIPLKYIRMGTGLGFMVIGGMLFMKAVR